MRVFVDLDGVLADFDGGYERAFGVKPPRALGQEEPADFWPRLAAYQDGHFYADLSILPGAIALWEGVKLVDPNPTVLTGIPHSMPHAAADKTQWVQSWLADGPAAIPVICCASKDKRLHGQPGDVLIDDWAKYRALWCEMGGTFLLHTSVKQTLFDLFVLDQLNTNMRVYGDAAPR